MSSPESSTWGHRLVLNLLSYSLVLLPIATVVLATKYRLFPDGLRKSVLVQWFVFGSYYSATTKSQARIYARNSENGVDNQALLEGDSHEAKQLHSRSESTSKQPDSKLALVSCFLGLQISYLIWGLLQEKIMTTSYEPNASLLVKNETIEYDFVSNETFHKEDIIGDYSEDSEVAKSTLITFHDSQFLVFLNRITAFIFSIIVIIYQNRPRRRSSQIPARSLSDGLHSKPPAPIYEYIYCSLSNILSSWCQYEALKYVDFPTQVLSKSCKIVPVMLMSKIMMRKRYQSTDYIFALLLSMGMFVFLLYQPSPSIGPKSIPIETFADQNIKDQPLPHLKDTQKGIHRLKLHRILPDDDVLRSSLTSGICILVLYLAFDSFTSNWQQSLFTRYAVSNWQMMGATNFYSIMLTLTSLHQLGHLKPAIDLLASSKDLLFDCLMMSIMSSVGQLFVFYTIRRFGSVIFTVIMTLRQLFAILLSCATYGHRMTGGSIAGIVMIFFIVGFQMWFKSRANHNQAQGRASSGKTLIQFKTLTK